MSARIFNREFSHPADGWYQIETPGEHPNKAGGVVQVIDSKAVNSIVNSFNTEADNYAKRNGTPFPGMLIDHEHFKHDSDKETRAYGWLLRLQNRDGVPYGEIHWTTTGQQAVDGGDYRYFSSEYGGNDLEKLSGNKVRPLRLSGLTLTNQPNNKGGSPATTIVNRDASITQPVPGKGTQRIPTQELENWFQAVAALQRHLIGISKTQMPFEQAWKLCKQQHREIYDAAFSKKENSGGDPTDDSNDDSSNMAAREEVANLVNRVRTTSGKDFNFSYNFVRQALPGIYNRQFKKNKTLVNRENEHRDDNFIKSKAARLFNRLAKDYQKQTKAGFTEAWRVVSNREELLHRLASGKVAPEIAFFRDPKLRDRLENET